MKKYNYYRPLRKKLFRLAQKYELLKVLTSISKEKYAERLSASIIYALLSALAVNVFYEPGGVYSSGATGLAQIVSSLAQRFFGLTFPISLGFYMINLPLLIAAWYKIGHKFTVFTFITVSLSAVFIQFVPHLSLVEDPLTNAIFGAIVLGTGIGFALKNNISSGGSDIVSILIRKRFGTDRKSVV